MHRPHRNLRSLRDWLGLPGDLQWWALFGIPGVPTVLAGIVAFLRDAALWQVALTLLAVYVVAFAISVPAERSYLRRRRARAEDESAPPEEMVHRTTVIHAGSIGTLNIENATIETRHREGEPQEEHEPGADDEFDYETRSHFKDESVYLPLFPLVLEDIYIRDRTFINCRIYGPAIITPIAPNDFNSTFSGCSIQADDPDEWLWPASEERSSFMGIIGLEGCFFENCDFHRVGILVKERFYAESLRILRGQTRELGETSGETTDEEPANQ